MTLRRRTLITIAITLLSLILLLYVSAQRILLDSYTNLENRELEQDLDRVVSAFDQQLLALDALNHEWAGWDDVYEFVVNPTDEFIRLNMHDKFFSDMGFHVMLFINTDGEVVYGKAFDQRQQKEIPVPESIYAHFARGKILDHPTIESILTGVIDLPEGTLLISSRPILTSEFLGPIRGTLIIGRRLDDVLVDELGETAHLSVNLWPINGVPASTRTNKLALRPGMKVTELFGEGRIAGYTTINDIYGDPALIVRVDIPRDLYAQGQASLSYFLTSLLVTGVVFSAVVLVLLERTVLSRLFDLSEAVSNVKYDDLSASTIPVRGRDELSRLAKNIQGMLATLTQYHDKLHESNADLEARVKTRTQELEAALKVKTQILANVSHDARTPLNVITLNVQLLQRYADLNEKAKTRLNNIVVSTTQLLHFFNNLLEEARSTPTAASVTTNPFTAQELLNNAVTPMRVLAEQKGLSIKTEIEAGVPSPLYGDVKRLEQVLSNLISNAIKFTAEGVIDIRVFCPDDNHWGLAVIDKGRGIALQDQANIFEEFWQVDSSMTRDVNRGVGLGLSIVKRLVTLMEGSITVQSHPGIGSTFTVILPLVKERIEIYD